MWEAIFAAVLALLLIVSATQVSAQGGDATKGAALFETRCTLCHGGEGQGPSLKGVVGRKAGSAPGYSSSAALAGSGLTWTPATLDLFLASPAKAVPGTTMPIAVADPAQRADLIAYLATLKP